MYKDIICLANSKKYLNRCFAGKHIETFKWIRPIGRGVKGEVTEDQMRFSDGRIPEIFDIVRVPLKVHSPSFYQPENYSIASGKWEKIGTYDCTKIDELCDVAAAVWYNEHCRDRIPLSTIKNHPIGSSLLLLKVEELSIKKSRNKKQIRAVFTYNDVEYDLSVTDTDIEKEFETKPPGDYPFTDDVYLCLSLGEPFMGYTDIEKCCYKLVASVIRTKR